MRLLIDGYNLLHVTSVFVDCVGPGSLERLHQALLDFLVASLEPEVVERTAVVFDAKGRRAGGRRTIHRRGITVHYAARHETADALIVELLQRENAPRQLLVVSSDHAVQRAARRRRAKAIDSDRWHFELLRHRDEQQAGRPHRPVSPLGADGVAWWLRQFGIENDQELSEAANAPRRGAGESVAPTLAERRRGCVARSAVQADSSTPPAPVAPAGPAAVPADVRSTGEEPGRGPPLMLRQPFSPEYLEQVLRELEQERLER